MGWPDQDQRYVTLDGTERAHTVPTLSGEMPPGFPELKTRGEGGGDAACCMGQSPPLLWPLFPPPFVIATPKYGINTVPTPTVATTRA